MKTLEMNEMERIEGGASMSCDEFHEVLAWLSENHYLAQLDVIASTYTTQYCPNA